MDRRILHYLPTVLQTVPELLAIMDGEQPEIAALWDAYGGVLNNQFVLTATEYCIKRWEMILKIYPKDTDGLELRRARVLSALRLKLPYTMRWLIAWLDDLCGRDGYEVELKDYTLSVYIDKQAMQFYNEVYNMLKATVPSNLVLNVSQRFNRHGELRPFTHAQLSQKTHEQIKEEVPFSL